MSHVVDIRATTSSAERGRLCTFHLVVTSLRQRIALAALVGVLLIPLVMSSLGGIGQLLACEAEVAQPFAVTGSGGDDVAVTSSRTLDRDADPAEDVEAEADEVRQLCGGVTVDIAAQPRDLDEVELTVTITNDTDRDWQGSIGLATTGDVDVDLTTSLGNVPAGESRSDTLVMQVQDSQTDIAGRLLLGP